MPNTIRHKRGTTTPAAGSLVTGELAINTSTGAVFTKTDAGTVVNIGGGGGAPVNNPTFTGTVTTAASTTTAAGLNIPHGTAPTTPVNGDFWTTTGGIFWRQNGGTQQAVDLGGTQTINGNKTFSNATNTFGSSTGTGTIGLGSGATTSGSTKTVNIGTAGVAGSTTNINIGTTTGTATATVNALLVSRASAATAAGLRITPGVAPTTPVNGDVWATSTDLQVRLNGVTETIAEQSWVTSQGYITSSALSGYATQSFVTGQGYLTSSALTGYATESFVTGQGYLTSASLTGYATESWVTSQGYLTSAPVASVAGRTGAITLSTADVSGLGTMATATAADYSTTAVADTLYYPLNSNPSAFLTAVPAGYATESFVTSQGYITSSGLTAYAALAGATFTGKINTPASSTTAAGLNIPHGTAPTTPANGDIWTTTTALVVRLNGLSQNVPFTGAANTFSGTNTFSGASLNLGTSTAASTINVGTGATLTATTKAVNIGTGGVAGSTTNITIGSTTGTSTTTLQGTTNGVTQAAGTNNTSLATTAFVRADNNVKAWVNFNGTGTVAIRSSFNVSSITDHGVGSYTVNMTNALVDTNFVSMVSTTDDNLAASFGYEQGTAGQYRTTTAFRFYILGIFGTTPNPRDNSGVYVAISR